MSVLFVDMVGVDRPGGRGPIRMTSHRSPRRGGDRDIEAIVKDLTPEHAEGYLAAQAVVETLDLAG